MTKYCKNCKQKLDDHMKFCPVCGTKIEEWESVINMDAGEYPKGIQKKKRAKNYIIIIFASIIIIILALVFVRLRNGKQEEIKTGDWTVTDLGNLWMFEKENIDVYDSTGEAKFKAYFRYYWGDRIESRSVEFHLSDNGQSVNLNSSDSEVSYCVTVNDKQFLGIVFPIKEMTGGVASSDDIVLSSFASEYVEKVFTGEVNELAFTIGDEYKFEVSLNEDVQSLYEKIKSGH